MGVIRKLLLWLLYLLANLTYLSLLLLYLSARVIPTLSLWVFYPRSSMGVTLDSLCYNY